MSLDFGCPKDQADLFLWKHNDLERKDIYALLTEFHSFSQGGDTLDEFQTCRLFEQRGDRLTASEVRQKVRKMIDKSKKCLTFLEVCCAIFDRPLSDFVFTDPKVRADALAAASAAATEREAAIKRLQTLKEKEEEDKQREQEELVREASLTGVAGKAAFFKRKMVHDDTATNAAKLKQEAALRSAVKKARQNEEEALRQAEVKQKSMEEVEREIAEARRVAEELAAAEEVKRLEEEKSKRLSRREEMNAVWQPPAAEETVTKPNPADEKERRALRKKALNAKWGQVVQGKPLED